jgi:hypothetical protein
MNAPAVTKDRTEFLMKKSTVMARFWLFSRRREGQDPPLRLLPSRKELRYTGSLREGSYSNGGNRSRNQGPHSVL